MLVALRGLASALSAPEPSMSIRPVAFASPELRNGSAVCLGYGSEGYSLNVWQHEGTFIATGHGRFGPYATFLLQFEDAHSLPRPAAGAPPTIRLTDCNGHFLRAAPAAGGALMLLGDGTVASGDDTRFRMHAAYGGVHLESVLYSGGYVSVDGEKRVTVAAGRPTLFTIVQASSRPHGGALPLALAPPAAPVLRLPPPPPYSVGRDERIGFASNGYMVLHNLIPPLGIHLALRCIAHSIGGASLAFTEHPVIKSTLQGRPVPADAATTAMPAGSPEALAIATPMTRSSHPAIVGLFTSTAVASAVESLIGVGHVAPVGGGQVAPRFPRPLSEDAVMRAYGTMRGGGDAAASVAAGVGGERPDQGHVNRWHIDGMDREQAAGFTLLVGVMLNDTMEDHCGQFTVYPQSHMALCERIAKHGMLSVVGEHAPRPPLPVPPVQLHLRAGDVVFAHPLLAHSVGVNFSPHIRYAAFFRVNRVARDERKARVLAGDVWAEFDGVRAFS